MFRSFAVAGNGEEGVEYLESLVEYDTRGNVVRETKFLEDGKAEEINTYAYDSSDRLTEHTLDYVPDEASEKRVLERDPEGRVTRESKYYGELAGERTEYTYDDAGNITEIKSFDEEGDFSTREEIAYDEKKQVTLRVVYDPNNEVLEKREFSHSDDGLSVEEKLYDKNGELQKKTLARQDADRRETDSEERTGQGKLISAMHSLYDGKGNLLERQYKDFNSKVLRYRYDDQNRCTAEELFDDHGVLLRKHLFEFDAQGRLETEQNYEMNAARGARDKHLAIRYEYENY